MVRKVSFSHLLCEVFEKEGISQEELEAISGSGAEGRVTKKDVLAHLTRDTQTSPEANIVAKTNQVRPEVQEAPVVVPSGKIKLLKWIACVSLLQTIW